MGFTKDLWHTTARDADGNRSKARTARYGRGKRWLAVWLDPSGDERSKAFETKVAADAHWRSQETDISRGTYLDPKLARLTVGEWCETWLQGYATRRRSTVRQARVHVAQIEKAFGQQTLSSLRPSGIRAWTAELKAAGLSVSYVYACHGRLSQILDDAVHDGILARNPCSRRTSPGAGKQRPYCATTAQVWGIYEAFPEHLKPAVLLGAFVGFRTGEAAGGRVEDVDFTTGLVTPALQYPAEPLKSETSMTPVPIPVSLAGMLAESASRWGTAWLVTDGAGRQASPWSIERAMRSTRTGHRKPLPDDHAMTCPGCLVPGLPAAFRFHDLRHYLASLLIASGADVKVVQARMRHASAKTTLDTYGHLWPDKDESTRVAVAAALAARVDLTEQSRNSRPDS